MGKNRYRQYTKRIEIDIPEDDKHRFGSRIDNFPPPEKIKNTPLFGYDLLIVETNNKFSFTQENFHADDYKKYFQKVREYSRKKICDLMTEERNDNFGINFRWNDRMHAILKRATGIHRNWPEETKPLWGHFHLYSPDEKPEDRCPVIHFAVFDNKTFYILCYDRYHDIHDSENR